MNSIAKEELYIFLSNIGTETVNMGDNLKDFVEHNFDVISDQAMHSILQEAISIKKTCNDSTKTSAWELILENVHAITIQRRENAANNIQLLIKLGQEGNLPQIEAFICSLVIKNQADRLLCEILGMIYLL